MQIQLNSDNRIAGSAELLARVRAELEHELKHVAGAITRIEVHLNDVNGARAGAHDKRCLIEARLKGSQPVAVESRAATIEQAIGAAAGQLSRVIKTTLDKSDDAEKHGPSIRQSAKDDQGE